MSIDPDFRIALAFILLLRAAVPFAYPEQQQHNEIVAELRRLDVGARRLRRIVGAMLLTPLLVFLFAPDGLPLLAYAVHDSVGDHSSLRLPDLQRWFLLAPAVSGLLIAIWFRHTFTSPMETASQETASQETASQETASQETTARESVVSRLRLGPYRLVRYPDWSADLLLCGALLVATDNWFAVISFLVAFGLLRIWLLPRCEAARRSALGEGYAEFAEQTGLLLPKMPHLGDGTAPQYTVPRRFGMSAIIALTTMFAVMFGILNEMHSRISEFNLAPTVHLYFGSLLMLVWVAQMRFGRSARQASVIVGTLLLPLFVWMSLSRIIPPSRFGLLFLFLCGLGGLIGYCMGALAAGMFLIADWLGPYLRGNRQRHVS